ncbi:MAG: hypothetical protein FWE67_04940 [Planctomycetaceae bacterium]|nr:hypothetical protein [Planctomycetaceae bacterium]
MKRLNILMASVFLSALLICAALVALLFYVTPAFCQEGKNLTATANQAGEFTLEMGHHPVKGTVTLDGKPIAGAVVSLIPSPEKRPWGPEQATGKPDAYLNAAGGDYPTAWASLTEDGQEEWLELTWDKPIEAAGVDVYETFNPGALVKIIAYDPVVRGYKKEVAKWAGVDPTPCDAPNGKGISKIRFEKPVLTNRVTLYLDSPKVPGWNEIDAVGLVDTKGEVHWATGATASSTYADVRTRTNGRVNYFGTQTPAEEPKKERNWAAPEKEERVREVLRKLKDANTYWFSSAGQKKVESCKFAFHLSADNEKVIDWNNKNNPGNWYTEFYRKGISYIGVSRLLVVDIDGLRCTSAAEDTDAGTITFDFVLAQEWMNAVGNGISGSWRGWFNGVIGEGKAVIDTKTNTLVEIVTKNYDEKFFDYVELEPGKFVPQRIVVDYHKGSRDKPEDGMYFDFRFKVYEPCIWLFDMSIPRDVGKPIVWVDNVQINGKEAVELKKKNEKDEIAPKQAERIKSYKVGKSVAKFPAVVNGDIRTPESAYAFGNQIIAADDPEKIKRLRTYTVQKEIPKDMEAWITDMTPEVRSQMGNAEILQVFIYKDKYAMTIAEVVKGEKYNNRLFEKQDGRWFGNGGGGLFNGKSADEVVKMLDGMFAKLADNWDKVKDTEK